MANESDAASVKGQNGTCEKRSYERPVAWLLGRQLMGSLKGTLLYTAFGNKIDPRDWMEACSCEHESDGEDFWFDYIADTGDGMRAAYGMAYLTLSDLWVKQLWQEMPSTKRTDNQTDADSCVKLRREENGKNGFTELLPRGRFLLVGGDTTYHLADYTTLVNRFQTPFKWAYEDLKRIGAKPDTRPLYGIPGNHDYYDLLDGFRRQFRKPTKPDKENIDNPTESAQLIIPGFERRQQASYLAVKLPWDWWLWGLDTELGAVDNRQRKFFATKNKEQDETKTPDKLIVSTCAPTTVFGKYARWEDKKSAQTFFQLKLPWFFWAGNKNREEMKKEIKEELEKEPPEEVVKNKFQDFEKLLDHVDEKNIKMPDNQCRLDLSGDVHLYARYWGPKNAKSKNDVNAPPSCDHYASVVSGSGGAFHHSTYTDAGELREQALYPSKDVSLKAFADRIFNPFNIMKGGSIWILGFIMAFILYFGITIPKSSQQAIDNLVNFDLSGNSSVGKTEPTMLSVPSPVTDQSDAYSRKGYYSVDKPIFYNELKNGELWNFRAGGILLSVSFILLFLGIVYGKRLFGVSSIKLPVATSEGETNDQRTLDREWVECEKTRKNRIRQIRLWGYVIANIVLIAVGFHLLRQLQIYLTPFASSMLVLFTLFIGAAAFYFCIEYSEWLFEKTRTDIVTNSDWYLVRVVSLAGAIGVPAGLWYFGKYNLPVYILTDILFVLVVLSSVVGLILLACLKGGEMLEKRSDKLKISIVGVWHAVLQIAIPFIVIRWGTLLSWILTVFISCLAIYLGKWAMKNYRYFTLGLVWFIYGMVLLFLPCLLSFIEPSGGDINFLNLHTADVIDRFKSILSADGSKWDLLVSAILSGIVGAIMSCVWFGWYLAVCFLNFHGHNNEVGGAARIENFKQFIRFRVTENSITGYVIALNDVSRIGKPVLDGKEKVKVNNKILRKDGSFLEPSLIDVFRLTVKKSTTD